MDSLYLIYRNTSHFYRRFWSPGMPGVEEVADKLEEETQELIEVLRSGRVDKICDEIADVITVAIGGAIAQGISTDDIYDGILRSIGKNWEKQEDTHYRKGNTVYERK